jgi:hypothetical protein
MYISVQKLSIYKKRFGKKKCGDNFFHLGSFFVFKCLLIKFCISGVLLV